MIYRLPTRNPNRKYRGKYPNRVWSFSGRNGVYHVETNNGARYVLNGSDLRKDLNRMVGEEFISCTRYAAFNATPMDLGTYSAIVFIGRLARLCKGFLKADAVSQFDHYYPNSRWDAYLTSGRIIPSLNGGN